MSKLSDIVSPSGQPLIQERKVIILKRPKDISINPSIYSNLAKLTGCAILELPMDCEVMMGEVAVKELISLHHAIHAILKQPDFSPTHTEMKVIYSALRFLCERTSPNPGSVEVSLLKQLKPVAA